MLTVIADPKYRDFAKELNFRWKMLCRKISGKVAENPEKFSLIHLPHPVIVPGGRFREVRGVHIPWLDSFIGKVTRYLAPLTCRGLS